MGTSAVTFRFSAVSQSDEVYRFRSVDALLGSRKELSRQTIYLARPDELNDLAEDAQNLVWYGDDILWPNLITYYWRSLILSRRANRILPPRSPLIFDSPLLNVAVQRELTDLDQRYQAQESKALTDLVHSKPPVAGLELQRILYTLTPSASQLTAFPGSYTVPDYFPKRFVRALGNLLLAEWGVLFYQGLC